jgi:hypothetical protein
MASEIHNSFDDYLKNENSYSFVNTEIEELQKKESI